MKATSPRALFKVSLGAVSHARLACSLLACALLGSASAGTGDRLDFKYLYFRDSNRAVNHTPAFSLTKRIASALTLGWTQELDAVSGASRRLGLNNIGQQGDNAVDGVSGASRREIRHSEQASLAYGRDGRETRGSLYFSDEDDYTSISPSLAVSRDFNARNTTLSAALILFFDDLHPEGAFAGQGGSRRITSVTLGLTQLLTPLSLFSLSADGIQSHGYLGHPYNPVVLPDGALLAERLPRDKAALALSGRFIQGYRLGSRLGSLQLDGRYYRDSWELSSGTLDVQAYQYVSGTAWFRLRARTYAQGAAAFAKDAYAGDEAYRTSDIRYSAFTGLTVGIKLGSAFPARWGEAALLPDRWDLGYDHGFRDTRGDQGSDTPWRRYQLFSREDYYRQGLFMAGLGFDL